MPADSFLKEMKNSKGVRANQKLSLRHDTLLEFPTIAINHTSLNNLNSVLTMPLV